MISHRRRPTSAHRSERGAALVEFAIVALFIFTLTGATVDYGSAWRSSLAVNEATRTAARVGSAGGPSRAADFNALSGAKSALASSGRLDDVTRVVVFRSSGNGQIPTACKQGSSPACQVITGDQFRTNWQSQTVEGATNATGCLLIASSTGWCPTTRNNVQINADDYGVWIQLRHDFDFPLLGDGQTIERTTTMRLEPKV